MTCFTFPGLIRGQTVLRKSSIKKVHVILSAKQAKNLSTSAMSCAPLGRGSTWWSSYPKRNSSGTLGRLQSCVWQTSVKMFLTVCKEEGDKRKKRETNKCFYTKKEWEHLWKRAGGTFSAAIKTAKTKTLMPAVLCHTPQITSNIPSGFTRGSFIWTQYNSCVNKPAHVHYVCSGNHWHHWVKY